MTEDEDRAANADQNAILRRSFDPVLTEPIPARMYLRSPRWIEHAWRRIDKSGGDVAIGELARELGY